MGSEEKWKCLESEQIAHEDGGYIDRQSDEDLDVEHSSYLGNFSHESCSATIHVTHKITSKIVLSGRG
jgi:hypothetical protein